MWWDGVGRHWLVQMKWHRAGWSVCLPLLIFLCTIKSRSSLLALAHPGGPGKRAVKWLWCGGGFAALSVIVDFCPAVFYTVCAASQFKGVVVNLALPDVL